MSELILGVLVLTVFILCLMFAYNMGRISAMKETLEFIDDIQPKRIETIVHKDGSTSQVIEASE